MTRAPRVEHEAVVRIFCAGRQGIHTGFLKTLSAGGMFLHIVDPERSGTRLHFELRLDPRSTATVTGSGEVVYSREVYGGPGRPPGMGIRFLALTPEGAEEVERIVGRPADAEITNETDGVTAPPASEEQRESTPAEDPPDLEVEILVPPSPVPENRATAEARAPEAAEEGAAIHFREDPDDLSEYGLSASRPWWRRAPPISGFLLVLVAAGLVVAMASGWSPLASSKPDGPVAEPAVPDSEPSPVVDSLAEREVTDGPIAVPEPSAPPAELSPPAPLERVEAIDWEAAPGGLVVVVRGDGAFESGRATYSHIGGEAPRGVVRIRGVQRSLDPLRQELDSPHVSTVRTGFHGERDGRGDLHVVLDFRDPEARITGLLPSGRELLIYVGGS